MCPLSSAAKSDFYFSSSPAPNFRIVPFAEKGARAYFTAKQSGGGGREADMRTPQVRADFFSSLDLSASPLFLKQTHSATVHFIEAPPYPSQGDGLLTQRDDLALCIFVADCVPLFLFSPAHKVIGLVHVGWRGLAAGIVEETLSRLACRKWSLSSFLFALGPSIGSCCYEVGGEVLQALHPKFPDLPRVRAHLDMRGRIRSLLLKRGVSSDQLFLSPHCTCCDHEFFFSYRRDRTDARMMALLSLSS